MGLQQRRPRMHVQTEAERIAERSSGSGHGAGAQIRVSSATHTRATPSASSLTMDTDANSRSDANFLPQLSGEGPDGGRGSSMLPQGTGSRAIGGAKLTGKMLTRASTASTLAYG